MERKIFITSDGSSSIFLPDLDETYHSKHGAIQEAYHVFIRNGLDFFSDNSKISILEIGFGTGLNCFITYLESLRRNLTIYYDGVEAYPLKAEEIIQLNYIEELHATDVSEIFKSMHSIPWEKYYKINDIFSLKKRGQLFKDIKDESSFDLIYFDAFGANVQPELWTEEIFNKMYKALNNKGVLVTYAAKGSVRRAMQKVGFEVERLPGPPGKREMLRGIKD